MFDADQRLIVANQHYAEIYGLSADEVKPGTSLRQILEYRIAKGDLQGNADDILKAIFREVPFGKFVGKFRSRLKDGRCIEVSVGPTASGGTVTTHHDITEQRQAEARIAHLALHDALTGLANRTLLNERLQQALTRVARNAEIVAVLLLDLDHFKKVNDSLGHPDRRQATENGWRTPARSCARNGYDRTHRRRRIRDCPGGNRPAFRGHFARPAHH